MIPYNKKLVPNARTLRKNMTKEEKHLWYDFLKGYPIKIYKQRVIGNYIVDFYCHSARLVIELDGSQHYTDEGKAYDQERTNALEASGLTVIRFSNKDIDDRFEQVCYIIDQTIKSRINSSCGLEKA
jgi:very-short-patch-repair endonuclease